MHAIIDYDIVTYSCGFSVEKNHYDVFLTDEGEPFLIASFPKKRDAVAWVNGEENYRIVKRVEAEPVENALQAVKYKLFDVLGACKASSYGGYLTGSGNFREEIAVTRKYKGNRSGDKPVHYQAIRDYLINHHNAVVVDGMEADDAMAIEQCSTTNTIIATTDKDLDMIPGWHYNWGKRQVYKIEANQAFYNFYYQMLMGDKTDNIIGVFGCGPKTAEKLLKNCQSEQEMFDVVWKEYERENGTNAATIMQEMADLLYIKKHPEDRWNIEDYKSN